MTVFRVHKNENYTVLSNYHFKEKGMSLKAKGLLSLMLSLPDNWDYSAAGLVTLSKDGKDSVNAALKELEKFGYLKRSQAFNENGTFGGYNYEIFERPVAEVKAEKPKTEKPKADKPKADKPFTENPSTENPQQLNNNKLNTKKLNTNLSITEEEEGRKKETIGSSYDAIINGKIFEEDVKKSLYDFIKMRQMIKKPLSNAALEMLIDKLFKMTFDPKIQVEILENSILNNYPDIYKPKQEKKKDNVMPLFSAEIDEDDQLHYFKELLLLSDNQIGSLIDLMGLEMFELYTDKLKNYIIERGDVKNHYSTLVKWYKEDTAVAR